MTSFEPISTRPLSPVSVVPTTPVSSLPLHMQKLETRGVTGPKGLDVHFGTEELGKDEEQDLH